MIFSAFVVGFVVSIPPGTVTIAAAQKSISYGFKNSVDFIKSLDPIVSKNMIPNR